MTFIIGRAQNPFWMIFQKKRKSQLIVSHVLRHRIRPMLFFFIRLTIRQVAPNDCIKNGKLIDSVAIWSLYSVSAYAIIPVPLLRIITDDAYPEFDGTFNLSKSVSRNKSSYSIVLRSGKPVISLAHWNPLTSGRWSKISFQQLSHTLTLHNNHSNALDACIKRKKQWIARPSPDIFCLFLLLIFFIFRACTVDWVQKVFPKFHPAKCQRKYRQSSRGSYRWRCWVNFLKTLVSFSPHPFKFYEYFIPFKCF